MFGPFNYTMHINNSSIIVTDLIEGKKEAYFKIYKLYYKELCIYAAKMIQNIEDSQDLVQDAIIKLWNKRRTLESRLNLRAYLYKSVYNHAIDYIKAKQKDMSIRENMLLQIEILNTMHDENANNEELSNELENIIKLIPGRTKEVFELNKFEGLKYKDIAIRLNISVKGVEYHMNKAFRILEKNLVEFAKSRVS